MMRPALRYRQSVRVIPCRAVAGDTGGIALAEQPGQSYLITAAVRPDRKSERRERGSLRPRERRLLLPLGRPPIRQGDHLYFAGDARRWRCMQRRDFPAHLEIEAEVEG